MNTKEAVIICICVVLAALYGALTSIMYGDLDSTGKMIYYALTCVIVIAIIVYCIYRNRKRCDRKLS